MARMSPDTFRYVLYHGSDGPTGFRLGKKRVFRGVRGQLSDVKNAVVTLAEGERIDVTTGL